MILTSRNKQLTERLKALMLKKPKINPDNHKKDLKLCQDFLSYKNIKEFENLLSLTLDKIKKYLKYKRKQFNIENDYLDVLGTVSLIVPRSVEEVCFSLGYTEFCVTNY